MDLPSIERDVLGTSKLPTSLKVPYTEGLDDMGAFLGSIFRTLPDHSEKPRHSMVLSSLKTVAVLCL